MTTTHAFDSAVALEQQPGGTFAGHTSAAYANMVGPFGGISAAQMMQAVLQHPQLLGEPVSLTINFAAALADGPFVIDAHPARTNRSTQHWVIDVQQNGESVLTGTAFTAVRRDTWGLDEQTPPACPPPADVPLAVKSTPMVWVQQYEFRPIVGGMPTVWDGSGDSSLTQQWVRDNPPRPLDFASLTALSDIFFPRLFVRRATAVPVGTVTMTVYFHANTAQLQATGSGYLLAQAKAQAFRNGYFDHTAQLWNEAGVLLVTTHQLVYYKN
ncbi:MAG: thioesterase family protein [Rhodoferax sp.]